MPLIGLLRRHRERVVLLVCLAISLFLLGSPADLRFELARAVGGVVYAPANGAAALARHLDRLRGENQALRERLMTQADRLERAEELELEADRLRRLLEFRETESYRFLPAELLSYPLGFRERNLVRIDRGSADGVAPGMPVVSPAGLIGAVFAVHLKESSVLLLSSKDFAVSCRDRRSRVLGVFKWDQRRGFHVDRVDLSEDVREGDRIMTSGLGVRFPEGFLLGTVRAVRETPGILRKEILVEPAAPLRTLEDVFVVTEVDAAAPGFPLPSAAPGDDAGGGP